MKRRPRLFAILAIVPVLAVVGYTVGCASTTLPPTLSPSEQAAIRQIRFPITVGVERFKFPVYSEGLTKALQATELFNAVADSAEFKTPPDLIARIERTIYGKATIPCLTGISLGLIPTTVQEEHGYSFSFASGSGLSDQRMPVEFSYSGPSTLGWYCLILNLSPNRTSGDVYEHRRFREGLAWAVVQKNDQIKLLLKRGAA
jgi:hypothetical protein